MDDNIKKLFDIKPMDIPSSIPIFPLDNVLLLPFGKLPLNIFEERYIKMTLDSLKTHRMIGIIQPKNNNNELFQMGCIGKITSYIETPDYRLVLNLEGICRFVLHDRNLNTHGYYQATIDCNDYFEDLNEDSFEKLISDVEADKSPIPGSRTGRFSSEPSNMTKKYSRKKLSSENASVERYRG